MAPSLFTIHDFAIHDLPFTALTWPVVLKSLLEKMKRNVLGVSSRGAKLFDHAHCPVGVKAVHHDRRWTLQFRPRGKKRGDRIASTLVVGLGRAIVLRHQI